VKAEETFTRDMTGFAIVVCGSDQRLDFIPAFWHFLIANLASEVRAKVYLLGCTKQIQFPGITVLPTSYGASAPWSKRIMEGLKDVKEENILLITEDILFLRNDSAITIQVLYELFLRQNLLMLRLDSFPSPEQGPNKLCGPLSRFSLYRVSLQPTIWKRTYLTSLMRQDESIWEFELRGSRRSRSDGRLYAVTRNFIPYQEVIGRGYLSVDGARLLKRARIVRPRTLKQRGMFSQISIHLRSSVVKGLSYLLRAQRKYTGM
jgi:hypothetical protein